MPRFSSSSQQNGYADVHALYQLTAASTSSSRSSLKKSAPPPQRKPRHLEPVPVKQPGVSSQLNQYQHQSRQPHLLDLDERSISSKQLRSLVSTVATDRHVAPKSADESVKYQHLQRQPQQQQQQSNQYAVDLNEAFRRRSRSSNSDALERLNVDAVLSKLDAGGYGFSSVAVKQTTRAEDESQQCEEDLEDDGDASSSRTQNHRRSAHVRALQELKQHRNKPTPTTQSNQAQMDAMDLTSMRGTTLARYRRLVGMVARKNLVQILVSVAQNVAFLRKQHRCAARIQVLVWEFLLRRRCDHEARRQSSTVIVQCAWRCKQARKEVAARQSDRVCEIIAQKAKDSREQRAAIRIQRRFRAYSMWKSWTARRERACKTLVERWRSRTLRKQTTQKSEENAARRVPPEPLEHKCLAAHFCGDEQDADVTQHQDLDSVAPEPQPSRFQPAGNGGTEVPFAVETCDLRGVVSLVSIEQPAPSVSVEVLVPNQRWEKPADSLSPSIGSHAPVADEIEGTGRRDVPHEPVSRELCGVAHVHYEKNAICVTFNSSHSLRETNDKPELRVPAIKITPSQLKTTPVRDISTQQTANSCEERPWTGDTSSALESASGTSLEADHVTLTQKSAVVVSAERALKRFLARWKACIQEAARREREVHNGASMKIQSQVRRWLAGNRVRVVREVAIRSLRAQLETSWLSDRSYPLSTCQHQAAKEAVHEDGDSSSSSSSEDEEDLDSESSCSDQSSNWRSRKTGCCNAFLPIWNGEIPPGVQLRQLEPTSFWAWSWSAETWSAS